MEIYNNYYIICVVFFNNFKDIRIIESILMNNSSI